MTLLNFISFIALGYVLGLAYKLWSVQGRKKGPKDD